MHRVCCCDPPGGCPACFCASNSASSYLATWVSGINPTGLVATFQKEVVQDRFCSAAWPSCGFHHNNYNYHIELEVRKVGQVVVTKLPRLRSVSNCWIHRYQCTAKPVRKLPRLHPLYSV